MLVQLLQCALCMPGPHDVCASELLGCSRGVCDMESAFAWLVAVCLRFPDATAVNYLEI